MMEFLHTLEELTHSGWFILIDYIFHIFVVWHVIAHICRAGKRFHKRVHVPLKRLWNRVFNRKIGAEPLIYDRYTVNLTDRYEGWEVH